MEVVEEGFREGDRVIQGQGDREYELKFHLAKADPPSHTGRSHLSRDPHISSDPLTL